MSSISSKVEMSWSAFERRNAEGSAFIAMLPSSLNFLCDTRRVDQSLVPRPWEFVPADSVLP